VAANIASAAPGDRYVAARRHLSVHKRTSVAARSERIVALLLDAKPGLPPSVRKALLSDAEIWGGKAATISSAQAWPLPIAPCSR